MADFGFLLLTAGGREIAFPAPCVRGMAPWERPLPLPASAPWVAGLLMGEGEVWPVLIESYWGRPEAPAEVFVFLELEGKILAISGRSPRTLPGRGALRPVEPEETGTWSGTVDEAGTAIACLDARALYLELGLL